MGNACSSSNAKLVDPPLSTKEVEVEPLAPIDAASAADLLASQSSVPIMTHGTIIDSGSGEAVNHPSDSLQTELPRARLMSYLAHWRLKARRNPSKPALLKHPSRIARAKAAARGNKNANAQDKIHVSTPSRPSADYVTAGALVPLHKRPPHGFVSHAEWAPAAPFISYACMPALLQQPAWGFTSHAEWSPATAFVSHEDAT